MRSKLASAAAFGVVVLAIAVNPVIPIVPKSGPQNTLRAEHSTQRFKGRVVECTSAKPKLAEALVRHMVKSLEKRSSRVSIALYDRRSRTTCSYRADVHYDSASTVKPIVLGALLLAKGTDLSGKERSLAREMIVNSDNEATYALWDLLGEERIQDFLDEAGLEDTDLNAAGFMGLTQITAREQVKLLQLLTGEDESVLSADERAYILRLMREVQDDQRWGTPAGAPPDAVVQVKNGWLQRSSKEGVRSSWDRGDWKVHSMSAITGGSYDYGLVILTENNRVPEGASPEVGCDYGMETIERVAKAIHHDLYPAGTAEVHQASRPLVTAAR
ncbi:serine hydrolase [Streptomyces wuyuanensis]|uniref:Beta-lactamase class A n=1 Tax=Streptomyces wuyuanensis TaxID=1196353 RepID=A0A1G9S5A9_9ACTN|nr:serine hydrolase [Streptomyces wuyuanensis]SDM29935.1 Beta-lactamase class A [Streptomyces wuyuanensis]